MEIPKRMSIHREMTGEAICVLMAEGDRTVYKILVMCWQVDPNIILTLDSMNMRGAQIFAAYIGFCEGWFPMLKTCVMKRDEEMIAWVNQKVPYLTAVKDKDLKRTS